MRPWLACTPMLLLAAGLLRAQVVYEQVASFGLGADGGSYPASRPLIGLDGRLYGSTSSGGLADAGTLYRIEMDGTAFTVLHSFSGTDGKEPIGALAQDEAGVIYGVAGGGLTGTNGVVFRIDADGSNYAVIKELAADGSEGRDPAGGLMRASNGLLYGTTYQGGAYDSGTVFSLNSDGTEFTILREFGDVPADGFNPRCFLIEGADGLLYGTTRNGGTAGAGTLFRMTKFSFGYEVLKSFDPTTEGREALAGVIEGKDGRVYGTLGSGGSSGGGALYAVNSDGTEFTILRSLVPTEGSTLLAGICEGTDGLLYTVASSGGSSGKGTVMRLKPDGTDFAVIKDFGSAPEAPSMGITSPVEAPDGQLCFTTLLGGAYGQGTLIRMRKDGNDLKILESFLDSGTAATGPRGSLAVGSDGYLYGTSMGGGTSLAGSVFKIRADGSGYGIIRNLGQTAVDAASPTAGVIQASDSQLYGTTTAGGTAGLGALFRLSSDGTGYEVVHSFRGAPSDGAVPLARLTEGDDGFLYGVTSIGGALNRGTVFRIGKDGADHKLLRSFQGSPEDGSDPYGDLLQSRDGVLYGVTYSGGNRNAGTVFRLNPDGSDYAVVISFSGASQTPSGPWGGLIEGSDGRLYGTSLTGGKNGGTVFSLAKDGSDLRVLVALPVSEEDGIRPVAALVEDSTGRLWGTCWQGGDPKNGTVFSLAKDGSGYEVVHEFVGRPSDGSSPLSNLSIFADGIIYGTTTLGGIINHGTIFRLSLSNAVRIEDISKAPDGPAVVRVKAVPGWLCQLESSSALEPSDWTEVAQGQVDASGLLSLTDAAASNQPVKFYRARATPATPATPGGAP